MRQIRTIIGKAKLAWGIALWFLFAAACSLLPDDKAEKQEANQEIPAFSGLEQWLMDTLPPPVRESYPSVYPLPLMHIDQSLMYDTLIIE